MSSINELKEILKMVEQSSIQRFEHETTRITIVKNDGSEQKSIKVDIDTPNEVLNSEHPISELAAATANPNHQDPGLHQITSPTMGTYYSSQQAGGEPFVNVGRKVNSSTIVCVLEAMKLFTEIEAGVEGEIVETLVKDGDFIEYGQPLFSVRKGE
jgi:acetyl-CoA carboxylase biotin carboxyl carrier protein